MFVSADQLVAHVVGDYILQSDWEASEKTKKSIACLAHVSTYFLPFLLFTTSWKALVFIVSTHYVIDRWRLARYVCWAKNWLAPRWITPTGGPGDPVTLRYPKGQDPMNPLEGGEVILLRNYPWSRCSGTGYPPERPPWMATWLMIITDNLMHVLCNAAALQWLT
jgi:hypothetical protein